MLPEELAAYHIGYSHIAELGGLRAKQHHVPLSVNAFWKNKSFHNYADYAMGDSFHSGLTRLRDRGGVQCCAIMCAETLWWRCHRRIIADYLMAAGETDVRCTVFIAETLPVRGRHQRGYFSWATIKDGT